MQPDEVPVIVVEDITVEHEEVTALMTTMTAGTVLMKRSKMN